MSEHNQNEKNKAKEKILHELLTYAANQEAERIEDDLPSPEELQKQFQPSARFEKNMLKMIHDYNRKNKMKRYFKTTIKIAASFLITLTIFLTAALSVEATRKEILNFITETTQEYTNIRYDDRTARDAEQGDLFKDWEKVYLPEYIPEGFEITKTERLIRIHSVYYANQEGVNITYSYAPASGNTLSLDTEGAMIKEITILGNKALAIEKNTAGIPENKVVFSNDEMSFYLSSSYPIDELIKMAESVVFVK